MSSFVSTFEGERHKCNFKVGETLKKGDPKCVRRFSSTQSLSKLPVKLGGGGKLEDSLGSWKTWRPLQAARGRALCKTPVPELMGHSFFGSVGRI